MMNMVPLLRFNSVLLIGLICLVTRSINSMTVIDRFISEQGEDNSIGSNQTNVNKTKGRSEEMLDSLDHGFALNEYVSIVRQPGTVSLSHVASNSLFAKLLTFLASRSLLIKFPDFSQLFDASGEQGRKKKQGHGMYMMMAAAMMGGWMISMKLAAVTAIAGKALIASMVALLLAAVAALKKHESSSHHHRDYDVISIPSPTHTHHHQRSYENDLNDNIEPTMSNEPYTYYYNRYGENRT